MWNVTTGSVAPAQCRCLRLICIILRTSKRHNAFKHLNMKELKYIKYPFTYYFVWGLSHWRKNIRWVCLSSRCWESFWTRVQGAEKVFGPEFKVLREFLDSSSRRWESFWTRVQGAEKVFGPEFKVLREFLDPSSRSWESFWTRVEGAERVSGPEFKELRKFLDPSSKCWESFWTRVQGAEKAFEPKNIK
jgi:hypothetical protein